MQFENDSPMAASLLKRETDDKDRVLSTQALDQGTDPANPCEAMSELIRLVSSAGNGFNPALGFPQLALFDSRTETPSGVRTSDVGLGQLAPSDEKGSTRNESKLGQPASSLEAAQIPRDGIDKRFSDKEMREIVDYSRTLQEAGLDKSEAALLARQTMDRLKQAGAHIEGTPESQMHRANIALADAMHAGKNEKVVEGYRYLPNGQLDYLTDGNRKDLVKDAAYRFANPQSFVNQGFHMTCAVQSMFKQNIEAGDPARQLEQLRDIANTGQTTVAERTADGREVQVRTVKVDSRSFAPDAESGTRFSVGMHRDNGSRGMAGHIADALYGQVAADLRCEREEQPKGTYMYMARHVDAYGDAAHPTPTGEGFYRKNADGRFTLIAANPDISFWELAHLSRAMGGRDGAVFVHALLVDDHPPKGLGFPPDLSITRFEDAAEFRGRLTYWQNETGQSAQTVINAANLPGGARKGHTYHVLNARIKPNQQDVATTAGNVMFDNNWGSRYDLANVSDADLNQTMNPLEWKANPKSLSLSERTKR